MPAKQDLQISWDASNPELTPEQQRFNFLIAQIDKEREAKTQYEARIQQFRQDYSAKLHPLRTTLTAVCKQSVVAIDRLLDEPRWSRIERSALREILCGTAGALLEANSDDTELRELFDKHSEIAFDAAKQAQLQSLKEEAEEMTGLDLGEDADIRSEEDLIQRMYEEMAAQEAAADARRAEKEERQRKASPANRRLEEDEKLTKQSLREIYRKLASAVHPDREPDPVKREAKNALMQKINQAYESNDLLALFEAQLQVQQVNASDIGAISTERLKQYNKLLARQLQRLKAATTDVVNGFCLDFGLTTGSDLNPGKLNIVIQRQARHVRAEIAQQRQFLLVLADKAATKRWLKQQRSWSRDSDD